MTQDDRNKKRPKQSNLSQKFLRDTMLLRELIARSRDLGAPVVVPSLGSFPGRPLPPRVLASQKNPGDPTQNNDQPEENQSAITNKTTPRDEQSSNKNHSQTEKAKIPNTITKTPTDQALASIRKPTTVDPTSVSVDEEVAIDPAFATHTMATIFLAQGRLTDARKTFEALLQKDPKDARAKEGLTKLQSSSTKQTTEATQAFLTVQHVENAEPQSMLDREPPPERYNDLVIRALAVDPVTVVVFWELTEQALMHASLSLGSDKEKAVRAIRVVSLFRGENGTERITRTVDRLPLMGDYFFRNLPPDGTHFAAVGLRVNDKFVPVMQAAPVTTPRGKISPEMAEIRAAIEPIITAPTPATQNTIWNISLDIPTDQLVLPHRLPTTLTPDFRNTDSTNTEKDIATTSQALPASNQLLGTFSETFFGSLDPLSVGNWWDSSLLTSNDSGIIHEIPPHDFSSPPPKELLRLARRWRIPRRDNLPSSGILWTEWETYLPSSDSLLPSSGSFLFV